MEDEKTIEKLVHFIIGALDKLGFFERVPPAVQWRIDWNDEKLAAQGLRAAATLEGQNPVLLLSRQFRLATGICDLIHEAIHMAQIIKGDLVPGFNDGTVLWKGQCYQKVPPSDPHYMDSQPWEAEASALTGPVLDALSDRYN